MITLVTGKPDSGKSALAEDLALAGGYKNRYYIATMKVMDEAGRARVEKHRRMREGKGFVTLEIPLYVGTAIDNIEDPDKSVVLLECVANLVGNEMHDAPNMAWMSYQGVAFEHEFALTIVERITKLANRVCDMIVVTARFDPDPSDDEETALYKRLVDSVNSELCKVAGEIKEV